MKKLLERAEKASGWRLKLESGLKQNGVVTGINEKFAFCLIVGMPRSGTTEFKKILNKFSNVFIFNEMTDPRELDLQLYADILAMSDAQMVKNSNIVARDRLRQCLPELDVAVVGEKVPGGFISVMRFADQCLRMSRRFNLLFIERSLVHLAASYQTRADRVDDKWPKWRGLESAILEYEVYLNFVDKWIGAPEFRNSSLFVSYDQLFAGRRHVCESVFDKIGVDDNVEAREKVMEYIKLRCSKYTNKVSSHLTRDQLGRFFDICLEKNLFERVAYLSNSGVPVKIF